MLAAPLRRGKTARRRIRRDPGVARLRSGGGLLLAAEQWCRGTVRADERRTLYGQPHCHADLQRFRSLLV